MLLRLNELCDHGPSSSGQSQVFSPIIYKNCDCDIGPQWMTVCGKAILKGKDPFLHGTLTSWTSLGPKLDGWDFQRRSREDLLVAHSHMRLISLVLSLFTRGNAFRRWGKMSRGGQYSTVMTLRCQKQQEQKKVPDSKEANKAGKCLLFCSPVLFSVFRLRASHET